MRTLITTARITTFECNVTTSDMSEFHWVYVKDRYT